MSKLIEDIYETIAPLSDGKPIEVLEEDIESFGEAIKNVMRDWTAPTKRDSTFSIRMSNVGKPLRKLWFDSNYSYDEIKLILVRRLNFYMVTC